MAGRLVAVPDTDQELTQVLGRLEEVLLALVAVDADDEPAPAGLGTDALDAVQDIRGAVLAAERGPTAQLYASDGTFELIPVRFVELDEAQLAAVGEAVAALGLVLLPGGDEFAHDVLSGFAERGAAHLCLCDFPHGAPHLSTDHQAAELVASFARAHGLVDLAPDADTWTLAGRLAGEASRVVLGIEEEAAYKRLTDRALAMFYLNDPLARFLYRGV